MTEVEKMRALLAEARAITQDSLDSNTTGLEDVNEVCVCDSCERYRSIIQRIDAALAEPVGECARCETLRELADTAAAEQGLAQRRMMEAQKQRDEARADASLAETRLAEIVELVGEGGDGSAFGSVESMLATFTHRQEVLQKQRDEARAEVERLKAHSEVRDRLTASEVRGLLAKLSDALHEGNKTRAEVAAAYQRGAEAMREAAARVAEAHFVPGTVKQIRALPVPEDKP